VYWSETLQMYVSVPEDWDGKRQVKEKRFIPASKQPAPKITDNSQSPLSNQFINFRTYGNHKISLTQNSAQAILQRGQKAGVDRH
jgi:hypothetical protein